jgi:hypothetical protein
MIYACTATAMNYLPKIRMMCGSIKKFHPELSIQMAVADKIPEWFRKEEYFIDNVISMDELPISNKASWMFDHNITELCTAIKPYMLNLVMDKSDCEGVLFFDPDMVLFSRLDDLLKDLRNNSIILTPHQTRPEQTAEAIKDNEMCSLRYGIYNLGFIGVRKDDQGRAFLKWWAERLYHYCKGALDQGIWMDQKWVDFAPAFFGGVKILQESRFNVAPWNITTRKATGQAPDSVLIDGKPLGFYHFTGFDSGAHFIMANKYAGENKTVMDLVNWYEQQLNHDTQGKDMRWAYDYFENGEPITADHRILYLNRKDLQEHYPNPFETKVKESYYSWYRSNGESEVKRVNLTQKPNESKFRYYLSIALTDGNQRKTITNAARVIFRKKGLKGLWRALFPKK